MPQLRTAKIARTHVQRQYALSDLLDFMRDVFKPLKIAFLVVVGVVTAFVTAARFNISLDRFRSSALQANSAHSVRLNWTASPSPSVNGYYVYRSLSSGIGYRKLNSKPVTGLSFVDTSIETHHIYYYVVTAVSGKGDESGYSQEIQIKVP